MAAAVASLSEVNSTATFGIGFPFWSLTSAVTEFVALLAVTAYSVGVVTVTDVATEVGIRPDHPEGSIGPTGSRVNAAGANGIALRTIPSDRSSGCPGPSWSA